MGSGGNTLSGSRRTGLGLVLLLRVVALAPSVCLLWFMNQAARNERLAVRQKLVEAYRGHLVLAQERVEAYWQQFGSELEAQAGTVGPGALFATQVSAGRADAVICFDSSGRVVYPNAATPPKKAAADEGWSRATDLELTDPSLAANGFALLAQQATNASLAARAFQAEARCLVQAGKKQEAISVLLGPLAEGRYADAADSQGTLVVPNAQLMAIELLKDTDLERARATAEGLKKRLGNYESSAMPASQRRFLMRELTTLFPEQGTFPTLAAEDLAAQYLETVSAPTAAQAGLRATTLPGIWQFVPEHGRLVTLHQGKRLMERMGKALESQPLPADVRVDFLVPGEEARGSLVSQPAGSTFPGWRVALSLRDQQVFDAATDKRIAFYVWIGLLVVALVAVLAMLALRLLRRQMALTQLRNDLVANVTHELKTPLASMRLLVDTLLSSPQIAEKNAREYLQLIAQENLRLSRLIDNFLAFSRMERNKHTFEFKPVAAGSLVEGACAAVRERFHTAGCRFQVRAAPDLPAVLADEDAMVTTLVNLLDNAYKYSGEEKEITLAATAKNGSVSFSVKDNGIGLSARETKRIFKRFYQVDQRMSRSAGGCGLGLSIVKFIVTAHHGTVRVESEPGRGSTFTVELPVAGEGT